MPRSATGDVIGSRYRMRGSYVGLPNAQPPLSVCFVALAVVRATRSQVCFYSLHTPPTREGQYRGFPSKARAAGRAGTVGRKWANLDRR